MTVIRVTLAALLLLAVAAPAAGAATCRKSATGPARTIAAVTGETRSHVTVCDRRRGRARTIARGVMRASGGRRYTDAWGSSRYLVYVQARAQRGDDRVVATVLSARTLRVVRRVTVTTKTSLRSASPEVVMVDGAAVAIAEERLGVVLARRGQRGARLAGGFYEALAVEDGVTLRWIDVEVVHYRDVGTVPLRDGCPRRAAFAEQARTDRLVVSRSRTGGVAIRVCDRGTGRDPVVSSASITSDASSNEVRVVGAAGSAVLLGSEGYDRYAGCTGTGVTVYDGLTRNALRSATAPACGLLPREPGAAVLTPQGAAAWLVGDRLVGLDSTSIRELDRGAITDLAATADGVSWRSSGAPRSTPLA